MITQSPITTDFLAIKDEVECNDVAAAILVLAERIEDSTVFSKPNAERFGHELALSLKAVIRDSEFRIVSE